VSIRRPLLRAGRLHVGHPQRLGQGHVVVADVVGDAGLGGERERVRLDEVAPADLLGRDPELVRGEIHHPLDAGGGLGPPGAAERADGGGVGHHAERVEPQLGHVVDALGHQVRRADGQRAAEAGVRPALAEHAEPQADDAALGGEPELGELHLPAALHREHRLAAGLGPLDRTAEADRGEGDRGVVGADAGLAAEGPAHVRGDHPDVVVGPAQGIGQEVASQVRVLRGDPGGDLVAVPGLHQDGVALDGRGRRCAG
jgi:hypothetical protein